MQTTDTNLTDTARLRRQLGTLLALGLPLVGSHLVQMAITTTDTLMMGWYGVEELAALSVSGPIYFILFITGSGFGLAVTPMVASAVSSGDERQVRRVTRMGLWLSILFGLLVTPIFFFAEQLFLAIGQEPEVARLAGLYMPLVGIGLVPALLVQVLKSYLSALELTKIILYAVLFAAIFNAFANYLLIFGNFGAPELGIVGAGFASLVAQAVSLVILVVYAVKKRPDHALFQNFARPDWEAFRAVAFLGVPIGATLLAETGLFAASSIMMGWLGTIPLAAHGIALQIASISFMVPLGISQAVTVRVGQAWGRRDSANLRAAAQAGLILSGIAAVLTVAAFLLLPEFLIGLFLDPTEPARPEILATGTLFLAVAALFQLVDFGQVMALGMLRGVQDTRVPMIMAAVSYWLIGCPVAYVLAFTLDWGGVGLWLGLTAGLSAACLSLQFRFWRHFSKVPELS